jgi:hypothetical protein
VNAQAAPERSGAYKWYRNFERRLRDVRAKFGIGSPSEDEILDRMGMAWFRMSREERV